MDSLLCPKFVGMAKDKKSCSTNREVLGRIIEAIILKAYFVRNEQS